MLELHGPLAEVQPVFSAGTGMEITCLLMGLEGSWHTPSSPKLTGKETFTLTTTRPGRLGTTWVRYSGGALGAPGCLSMNLRMIPCGANRNPIKLRGNSYFCSEHCHLPAQTPAVSIQDFLSVSHSRAGVQQQDPGFPMDSSCVGGARDGSCAQLCALTRGNCTQHWQQSLGMKQGKDGGKLRLKLSVTLLSSREQSQSQSLHTLFTICPQTSP